MFGNSRAARTVRPVVFLFGLFTALFLLAGAKKGKKPPEGIFPIEDVRAGMKGYGLTVFKGREPERFDVEVISVIHQFLPKQDIILARCSHPVINHTGVIAGMSGSPVFLEGRLAGAVAYAWRFSKDPIAGVTPAENMVEYFKEHGRGKKASSKHPAASKLFAFGEAGSRSGLSPAAGGGGFWKYFDPKAPAGLVPLVTPLTGSMLNAGRAAELVEKELTGFFMEPALSASVPFKVGGGKKKSSAKGGKQKKALLEPGGPVAIQLVRGDLDLSGSGTVTAVKGNRYLAFGHPMFNFGKVEVPATAAFVHHCLASLSFSFKMTEPEEEVGALVLDRQAGILIDTSRKAHVIPLELRLEDKSRGAKESWSMEVLHHRLLTPSLVRVAVTSAVDKFSPNIEDAVIEAVYRIDVHGHKPLVLKEKVFQEKGTLSLSYSQKLSEGLDELLTSEFEEVRVDGVEADISIRYAHDVGKISGAYLSVDEAEEGDTVGLYVIVKPHRESERIYYTSFEVPQGTAGEELDIKIEPGEETYPPTVVPQDLDDVIGNLSKAYPPDSVVVTVKLPGQGVSVGGKILQNLPPSALDTLRPKAAYLGEQPEAVVETMMIYPGMLVEGEVKLELNVKGLKDK